MNLHNKLTKFINLRNNIENELDEADKYNPEIGADLRWSAISLSRAIEALQKVVKRRAS